MNLPKIDRIFVITLDTAIERQRNFEEKNEQKNAPVLRSKKNFIKRYFGRVGSAERVERSISETDPDFADLYYDEFEIH